MATLIKITRQDRNWSGITSKDYVIRLSDRSVISQWGAIRLERRRFYWAGFRLPQTKITKFRNEEKAKAYVIEKIIDKTSSRYCKLSSGKRILKHTARQ